MSEQKGTPLTSKDLQQKTDFGKSSGRVSSFLQRAKGVSPRTLLQKFATKPASSEKSEGITDNSMLQKPDENLPNAEEPRKELIQESEEAEKQPVEIPKQEISVATTAELSEPQETALPKYMSEEEKRAIVEKVKKNNYWYEANALSDKEIESLSRRIEEKIGSEQDANKKTLYAELKDFVQQTGYIFPELSHGSSAAVLKTIARNGIIPLSQVPAEDAIKGEQGRINPSRKKEDTDAVYAGFGQLGLGLAIGYARREVDPLWINDWNIRDVLKKKVTPPDTEQMRKKGEEIGYRRSDEWESYAKTRAEAYRKAYQDEIENEEGNSWIKARESHEYPVVFGFSKTEIVTDPSETNFFTHYLFDELMPGEVQLNIGDGVSPANIEVIACPQKYKEKTGKTLRSYMMDNTKVISLEALDLLQEFGITDVAKGEDKGLNLLDIPQQAAIFLDEEILKAA